MLHYDIIEKPAFSVIGREGSTEDGADFVSRLWHEANEHFSEIASVVLYEDGKPLGFWGLMSDFSRSHQPWEDDFSRGLYLAGAECRPGSSADGWTVWDMPAAKYLKLECENGYPFQEGLALLEQLGLRLNAAVLDFTDPSSGKNYLYYPISC